MAKMSFMSDEDTNAFNSDTESIGFDDVQQDHSDSFADQGSTETGDHEPLSVKSMGLPKNTTATKRGMEADSFDERIRESSKRHPPQPNDAIVANMPSRYPASTRPKPALQTKVHEGRVVGKGTNDEHVEYCIDTIVDQSLAQSSFNGSTNFTVYRRFSDFYWLRETLEQKYPGFIIPPLPDKTLPYLQNNLGEKFIQSRTRSLNYVLSHIASHSFLSRDIALKEFLIAEQPRFEEVRSRTPSVDSNPTLSTAPANGGLFDKVMHFGQSLGSSINNALSGAASAGAQRRKRDASDAEIDADGRFDEAVRYISELEPKIKFVQETANQLVEKNYNLSKALHELGLAFTNMGQSEQQSELGAAVTELGNVCTKNNGLSVLVNAQAEMEQLTFAQPIEDYVRLVAAAKHALHIRMKAAQAYELALGEHSLKRSSREKMMPDDPSISSAEREVKEAELKAENAKKEFELITERVLVEIERFKKEKSQDFKALILHYVQLQIEHNQAVERLWREVLPKLHQVHAPSEKGGYSASND